MGGTASAINFGKIQISEDEYRQGTKSLYRKADFQALAEGNMLTVDSLVSIFNEKYDVFFSYDHDEDIDSRNLKRISKINDSLTARGFRVCFIPHDIKTKAQRDDVVSRIDSSSCTIIFITQRYMQKIASNEQDEVKDAVELQFYEAHKKSIDRMVSVVMEGRCRRKQDWIGEVGMVMGNKTFIDFADDTKYDECIEDISRNVLVAIGGFTIKNMVDSEYWKTLITGKLTQDLSALVSSVALGAVKVPAKPVKRSTGISLEEEFAAWMVLHATISAEKASLYASLFVEKNIGSHERLRKKLVKNPRFLFEEVSIDAKDAEKLTRALASPAAERPGKGEVSITVAAPSPGGAGARGGAHPGQQGQGHHQSMGTGRGSPDFMVAGAGAGAGRSHGDQQPQRWQQQQQQQQQYGGAFVGDNQYGDVYPPYAPQRDPNGYFPAQDGGHAGYSAQNSYSQAGSGAYAHHASHNLPAHQPDMHAHHHAQHGQNARNAQQGVQIPSSVQSFQRFTLMSYNGQGGNAQNTARGRQQGGRNF